jgi:transcriptional regulator with XRE-family HTH domain
MDETEIAEVKAEWGKAIRQHRLARDMSLVQLGSAIGIGHGNLSKIETGKQGLTAERMIQIADALGISVSDLFKSPSIGGAKIKPRKSRAQSDLPRVADFANLKLIPEGIKILIDCVTVQNKGTAVGTWKRDPSSAIAFLSDRIRQLDSQPKNLIAHKVKDDSMQPRVCAGDDVVIDTGDVSIPPNGGIFAVILDGHTVSLRRLVPIPGGGILIACDSGRTPEVKLTAKESKMITIVGKTRVLQGELNP